MIGLCTPTHVHTYTDGTEPSMGSTHSDFMKLMESLSWSGMSWEEGYGLLSLRTFQMLSGCRLWFDQRGKQHHGMPPQRGIPEPNHPHERTKCLFGQVRSVRRRGGSREAKDYDESSPCSQRLLTLTAGCASSLYTEASDFWCHNS